MPQVKDKRKVIGWVLKSELTWYNQTPIEKADGTPIILEVWKDKEDFKECMDKGSHLLKVTIEVKS